MTVSNDSQPVSRDRKQEIASLAECVSDEYFPQGLRCDPEQIIRRKAITVSFGRYADAFDGMLEHQAGRFHVYCNLDRVEYRNAPRARFTLGHELGHFFIDEHRNELESGRVPAHPSKCEYESRNPVEQEADHFASNLLMPSRKFRERAARVTWGLPGILSLASDFGTSVTSTAIRYVDMEPVPCAIIKWGAESRAWGWVSNQMFAAYLCRTISAVSEIPTDSATGRALAGEAPAGGSFHQGGSTTAAWFTSVTTGGPKDLLLMEQAIRLGRFGVLTILYPPDGRLQVSTSR